MLVLTRKKGESLMIGDQIELTVLSVDGDAVKIGIAAPKDVQIYRKELYNSIKASNSEAAQNPMTVSDITKMFNIKRKS